MPASVTVQAPGKVNLQLHVGAPQSDGYHPLATIFQAVSLYEQVTLTARADSRLHMRVESMHPDIDVSGVPIDGSNLAMRAVELVRNAHSITDGADIHIRKGVPVAGGMAGGSADAAAALLAASTLWGLDLSRQELLGYASQLGADVAFSLVGGTAFGQGRGDQLSDLPSAAEFHWVFAVQSFGLSTPTVFGQFDQARLFRAQGELLAEGAVLAALQDGSVDDLGAALSNDLQAASLALAPQLADVLDDAQRAGALAALVSGSGPTVAVLARDGVHADGLARQLAKNGTTRACFSAHGPVPGATVVTS